MSPEEEDEARVDAKLRELGHDPKGWPWEEKALELDKVLGPKHPLRAILLTYRTTKQIEGYCRDFRIKSEGMPKRQKQPPQRYSVSTTIDGKTYTGSYYIEAGCITVEYEHLHETTQVGGTPHESLARIMLGELVRKSKQG